MFISNMYLLPDLLYVEKQHETLRLRVAAGQGGGEGLRTLRTTAHVWTLVRAVYLTSLTAVRATYFSY